MKSNKTVYLDEPTRPQGSPPAFKVALVIALLLGFVIFYMSEPEAEKVTENATTKTIVILCVDQMCYDDKKYITDQTTLTEAIRKFGSPGWMKELKYDPDMSWEDAEPHWEDDQDDVSTHSAPAP